MSASLTAAQIARQRDVLTAIRTAFNDALLPVAASLRALPANDVLTAAIAEWNAITPILNLHAPAIVVALDATTAMIPSDPQVQPEPVYVNGYFEGISGSTCSGWAAPTGCTVRILVDGTEVGTVRSSAARPDVAHANAAYGDNTGWTFVLPAAVDASKSHTITAFVGAKLLNSGTRQYGGTVQPPTAFTRFVSDFSSDAAIQRDFWHANAFYGRLPTVNDPSKRIDGLLEVPIIPGLNGGPGIGGTGCSWHWTIPGVAPDELWCEYDFFIDPDVLVGFNEEGCKLPGLAGAWEYAGQWAEGSAYGWFSARLWHRRPDAAGNCELAGYVYSARSQDAGNPFGEVIGTGKMMKPGTKYKLGQHIKLNSRAADGAWKSDGIFEILLDGVTVYSNTAFKMRGDPRATFQEFFVDIFHGGSVPPKAPIHYRIGNVIVDAKPITKAADVPVILTGPVPRWRIGAPKGQWIDIPGSAPAKTLQIWGGIFDGSYSGMYSDRVNSAIYQAGASGHAVSEENGVYGVHLMTDAPTWAVLRASNQSTDVAGQPGRITDGKGTVLENQGYWSDGRPAGCHLYWSGQVPIINGKPVLVRTFNAAGSFKSDAPWHTDAFHLDSLDWDLFGGDWPAFAPGGGETSCVMDQRNGRIYISNVNGFVGYVDTGTRKLVMLQNIGQGDGYGWGGMVVDPKADELLYDRGGFTAAGNWYEGRSLTSNVRVRHPYTWEGDPVGASMAPNAMVIQERNNCLFIVENSTPANAPAEFFFNRMDLNTWKKKNLGTLGLSTHIYNRIEDFPQLGGLVYMQHFSMNLKFYATE